jgi:hypothetical protein
MTGEMGLSREKSMDYRTLRMCCCNLWEIKEIVSCEKAQISQKN